MWGRAVREVLLAEAVGCWAQQDRWPLRKGEIWEVEHVGGREGAQSMGPIGMNQNFILPRL